MKIGSGDAGPVGLRGEKKSKILATETLVIGVRPVRKGKCEKATNSEAVQVRSNKRERAARFFMGLTRPQQRLIWCFDGKRVKPCQNFTEGEKYACSVEKIS